MTVLQRYQERCSKGSIIVDPEQLATLRVLQAIHDTLSHEHAKRTGMMKFLHRNKPITGLYLWGGVGIGKTMMLDCFYEALPFNEKLRLNFYQFMQIVHHELKALQGQENPLRQIAKKIAKDTLVLCFDEFIITDAVDALILRKLLCELFSQGVCIIATSNRLPENLCKKAWQENFLPAIHAINKHMTILHLTSQIDYRKQSNASENTFNHLTQQQLEDIFARLTDGKDITDDPLDILSRKISVKKRTADIAWFNFSALCSIPRSQQDYLIIAKKYKTIFISDIPAIPVLADNVISLFIRLIDVLYDAKIKVIFNSTVPVEELYKDGIMSFEFARTCSRLMQMQSSSLNLLSISQK